MNDTLSVKRVTSSQRLRGISITISGSGELLQATRDPVGTVVTTAGTVYDSSGRAVESTDSFGLKTFTLYNAYGEVVQTRRQSFDASGAAVELVTRTVYDAQGRVSLSTDTYTATPPVGGAAGGTPTAGTIVYATQTQYDSRGRAFRTIRLKDVQLALSVTPTGSQTSVTNSGTVQWSTETQYDSRGRVTKQIGPSGETTDYVYDTLGRQVAVVGPAVTLTVGLAVPAIPAGTVVRHRTETEYDALGRVWKQRTNIIQFADGTTNTTAKQETIYDYDSRGNVIKTTFPDGAFVTVTYDALGRKATETNQQGLTRTFTYDQAGRLV